MNADDGSFIGSTDWTDWIDIIDWIAERLRTKQVANIHHQ